MYHANCHKITNLCIKFTTKNMTGETSGLPAYKFLPSFWKPETCQRYLNNATRRSFYLLAFINKSVLPSSISFRISSPKRVFCHANQGRV